MSLAISPEVFPVVCGAVLGCVARYAYQRKHRWIYVGCALLAALCATMLSGEFRRSWGFLADDLMFVCLSACGAFVASGFAMRGRLFARR